MLADEEVANPIVNLQIFLVSSESQPVNFELHLDVELQNEENVHSDSKVSMHGRDVELLERDVHSEFEVERPNMKIRKEPRLSKYVRRHHLAKKIIGNKDARPMTRNKLRNESCLLSKIEPKTVRDALKDDDWCKAMEEEIKIEKNKT